MPLFFALPRRAGSIHEPAGWWGLARPVVFGLPYPHMRHVWPLTPLSDPQRAVLGWGIATPVVRSLLYTPGSLGVCSVGCSSAQRGKSCETTPPRVRVARASLGIGSSCKGTRLSGRGAVMTLRRPDITTSPAKKRQNMSRSRRAMRNFHHCKKRKNETWGTSTSLSA